MVLRVGNLIVETKTFLFFIKSKIYSTTLQSTAFKHPQASCKAKSYVTNENALKTFNSYYINVKNATGNQNKKFC